MYNDNWSVKNKWRMVAIVFGTVCCDHIACILYLSKARVASVRITCQTSRSHAFVPTLFDWQHLQTAICENLLPQAISLSSIWAFILCCWLVWRRLLDSSKQCIISGCYAHLWLVFHFGSKYMLVTSFADSTGPSTSQAVLCHSTLKYVYKLAEFDC